MSAGADLDSIPKPITPGPEMAGLARFHTDVTWTGTIQPDGVGPGTPAMTAVGWGTHQTIQDGRWIVGSYQQDQFLPAGSFVLTWQLHWVARLGPHRRGVPGHAGRQLRPHRRHARPDQRRPPDLRDHRRPAGSAAAGLGPDGPGRHGLEERDVGWWGALVTGRGISLPTHMMSTSACS